MTPPNRLNRAVRIGDGKISFIPGDDDHEGWLKLTENIRMVGRVQYANLFQVLGTTYGGGNGTTFGLPPAGDRFLLAAGTAHALGSTGGAETVALTAGQMPKHKHTEQTVSIAPTLPQKALLTSVLGISLADITKPPTVSTAASTDTGFAGNGEAHNNMPPFLVVNLFIFAGTPKP